MEKNQRDVKRIQSTMLKMAVCIAEILEKHKIPHMIMFGTLLGAVRHKGFIPWDDDFDFCLFDETYDAGIACLRKELPEDMFLEDALSEPLYFHAWAHVKDLNSTVERSMFPQDSVYAHQGICIDLYRSRAIPLSRFATYVYDERLGYLNRRKEKNIGSPEELERRFKALGERPAPVVPSEDYEVVSLNPGIKEPAKATDVFPLKKEYKIDNEIFWGPNDADAILTGLYGDYMTLPPENERIMHYSAVRFKDSL